jgi:hypothetical protein
MSEIYNKLMFLFMFVLFFTLITTILFFLRKNQNYHWLSFVWIDSNFQIKLISDWIDYNSSNVIYVQAIPAECVGTTNWWENKKSIKCLAALKNSWPGFYNWYWYK